MTTTCRSTTTFFFFSAFTIILSALYPINHTSKTVVSTTNNSSSPISLGLTFLERHLKDKWLEVDLINGILDKVARQLRSSSRLHHHHHHHDHKNPCDDSPWKSKLTAVYDVSQVLTVDLRGCANFSSVQKAVDAVPDNSHQKTLIIVDSGTYR